MAESSPNRLKTIWDKEKLLVTSIFKRHVLQHFLLFPQYFLPFKHRNINFIMYTGKDPHKSSFPMESPVNINMLQLKIQDSRIDRYESST